MHCAYGARCEAWAESCDAEACTCGPNGNPVEPRCVCGTGFTWDGAQCVAEISDCRAPDACEALRSGWNGPVPADERWFELHVEGDHEFNLINEWSSPYYWDDHGGMWLFYNWYAQHCGAIGFHLRDVDQLDPGTYTLPRDEFGIGLTYDGMTFSTQSGTVVVHEVRWCEVFDCTTVDVEIDAELTEVDTGAAIRLQGYIRGDTF